jgi:spermidine/putrescine transport system permease protein
VFTLSLDEIAVTFFLIGRQNTLPLQLWGLLRRGITPEVNAAATVIFAVSLLTIVLWSRMMRDEKG